MAGKESIRASLQVDLDLSKVKAKVDETNRIEDQVEKRADELKEKAKQVAEGLEEEESRIHRGVHRFEHKVLMHPLKHLARGAAGYLAAEIAPGFEGGESPSFLKKVGMAAVFGAAGGPEGSLIAALGVTVEAAIEEVREGQKQLTEIRKQILEEKKERKRHLEALAEKVEMMEIERASEAAASKVRIDRIAREADYETFLLMEVQEAP